MPPYLVSFLLDFCVPRSVLLHCERTVIIGVKMDGQKNNNRT